MSWEADDVAPAILLIPECLPDVVLLDVHLPGGGGQDVVTATKATHPQVRFLALSASVRRVAAGDAVFSPRLAGFVPDAFAALAPAGQDRQTFDPELDQLTPWPHSTGGRRNSAVTCRCRGAVR